MSRDLPAFRAGGVSVEAFGFRLTRVKNRRYNRWLRLFRNAHALLAGNGDLHGLVRCPPLANRLDGTARRVCEAGCGSGQFHLETLLRCKFQGMVVGLDVDFQALRCAQQTAEETGAAPQVRYVCGSAERLPFQEGVFDQIFLVDVLEHVHEDSAALKEGCRTLREGGRLEISTPTPRYLRVFGGRIHRAVGHIRPGYSRPVLVERLKAAGFEVIYASQNTGYLLWPWMALWYRLGWALWSPGKKRALAKGFCHGALMLSALMTRIFRPLDLFGGYCSNDIQAEKKNPCRTP